MTFLQQIGKRIYKAEELKIGDIVGKSTKRANYEDIHLYYVERTDLHPCFIKWGGPYCPAVYFKRPSIGFSYKDKVGRTHIYTPSEYGYRTWYEMPYEQAVKDAPDDEHYISTCSEGCYDLYLITDEYYKKMGNLIPHVEMPIVSLLFQTLDADKVFDYVRDVREDIIKFKELFDKIKNRSLQDG